jgi:hypothetical protein
VLSENRVLDNQFAADCKQDLVEVINKKLSRFVQKGYCFILLALMLNIPWIVLVTYADENIQYVP